MKQTDVPSTASEVNPQDVDRAVIVARVGIWPLSLVLVQHASLPSFTFLSQPLLLVCVIIASVPCF